MQKRLKILQIQPKYSIRSSDLTEEIIKGLSKKKFSVTSAYFRGMPGKGEMHSISEYVKYFNFSKREMKGSRIRALLSLWKFCKKEQFDVVITHRFKPMHMMLKLNKILKIPVCIAIFHCIGDFDRLYRKIASKIYTDNCWRFVGVSQTVSDYLLNIGWGFTRENVFFINNAIDIEKTESGMLNKKDARLEIGINNDDYLFGTVGRLVPGKGHIYLIKAFQEVLKKNLTVKLVIIGGGRLEQELKQYVKNEGLAGSVKLTGEIFDAYRLLKAFDTFVFSSFTEGLALVLLEAVIAQIPVITTNIGGAKEILGAEVLLLEPGNINELAKSMEKNLQFSDIDRELIVSYSYNRILEKFSVEIFRKKYRQLILGKTNIY